MTERALDLAALLADLEAVARELNPGAASALVGELERMKATVLARLVAASAGAPATPAPADVTSPVTLDVRAAARFLGISPTTLRRLTADGQVPHLRVGRRVLFRRATLERFAADRERFDGERS